MSIQSSGANENHQKQFLRAQKNEITEYHIYSRLAERVKNTEHAHILRSIAAQEKKHYEFWKTKTGQDVEPSAAQMVFYYSISRALGLSFGLKLMEKGESLAQKNYAQLQKADPDVAHLLYEEQHHEEELLSLINTKSLEYVSSIVLGLSDALVELTGALAGLTLALQNTRLIAMVGLITGVAASLSMAASEYLSSKEEGGKNAVQAGLITGATYIVTVALLIAPYFLIRSALLAFVMSLLLAIAVIFCFTFYTAVTKGASFKKKFAEMAGISLGVAVINFGIGIVVRHYFGIDA